MPRCRATVLTLGDMRKVLTALAFLGTFIYLCVRGVLLWLVLLPSVLVWLVATLLWPFAGLFGIRIPASPLFYSRWAAQFLDALLTCVTPFESEAWPWTIDMRSSRRDSWLDAW